jgi:hypothetical protein
MSERERVGGVAGGNELAYVVLEVLEYVVQWSCGGGLS